MANQSGNGPGGGIPLPIVSLNRWMLVGGVGLALVLQQPWIIALLFVILCTAVAFGPGGSLPFQVGSRLLAKQVRNAREHGHVEDRRLMRFNNSVAIVLFGVALVCFVFGFAVAGWILSIMVLVAASVALAGFCVGCFLFYRIRLLQLSRGQSA
jgi:hypothetical protein